MENLQPRLDEQKHAAPGRSVYILLAVENSAGQLGRHAI
jgi:hypothetical protein